MTHCCGQPAGAEIAVRVRANQWTDLKEALKSYQDANMQLNAATTNGLLIPSADMVSQEFEARAELCDAIERLVENAVEA
jgi:hypothetical protein